jgi:penicillin-binding protein A
MKKKNRLISFRLNMLFLAVFFLFSIMILRLGVVQIVYGSDYKREIERTEDVTVNKPVPRGKMFDRNGKVIVDNLPVNAITYTKYQGADQKEMLLVAERLAKLIEKDTSNIQERDKKDYWIMINEERAKEKITEKEWSLYNQKELTDDEIYDLQLDRVGDKELEELSNEDLEVLALYREFNSGYALTPQFVKSGGVTPEEYARVNENLDLLPGVDTATDWERSYPFKRTLRTVLGNVSTSGQGLPKEELDYYLARDYNRNDRVGTSYIEKQYEDVLQGKREKVKNITDKGGNVLDSQIISEGQRGNDLVLTVDIELQQVVEKIIEEELYEAKQSANTGLLDRAYVVLTNPKTGEVLTMAGKRLVRDGKTGKTEMQDDALGNISTTYNVGSAVKGATILTGFRTGAIRPNQYMQDTPIKIKGTPEKSSWKYLGVINDIDALKYSSNVYMFKTAISIGKGNYEYDRPLPLDPKGFRTIRESFAQFGLGVRTGIDLPNEQNGFKGQSDLPGFMLDLVIGQYDTYSTMQMAQYVSVIANGGYRVKPHIVKEIRKPLIENDKLGPVTLEINTTVLNRIDVKEEWLKRVQEGFRRVMQENGGTAFTYFGDKSYYPAGKTGTAEAFYDGPERKKYKEPPEVMNLSLVGYAPFNDPEVAMAIIVPWAYQGSSGPSVNNEIGEKVMDAYFDLKKRRQQDI